jgi:hypothetical protein
MSPYQSVFTVSMTRHLAQFGEAIRSAGPRLLRQGLTAIALTVFFAGLSSVASATCGDWLAGSGHSMPAVASEGFLIQLPSDGSLQLAGRLPAKKPCNGPMCQKSPGAPAPAVPPTILERVDRIGASLASAAVDSLAGEFALSSEWDARPLAGHPSRVEHPPRA